jgi:cytosine/adenosine deaminase-related metal-dependent hydrolase
VTTHDGRTLTIRSRYLLPMGRPPLENGWLTIRRGRVVGLGSATGGRGPTSAAGSAGRVLDFGDAILVPGLVNAHTHLEFSDRARPLETADGLPGWIGRVVRLRRERPTDDDGRAVVTAIRNGLAESAAAGVTSIGEIATVAAGEAYADGPRLRVFREALGLSPAGMPSALAAAVRDVERLDRRGVSVGLSPHAPYSVAAPLGTAIIRESVRRRLPVAMHLAESPSEEQLVAFGSGPFRSLLEELGAWDAALPPRLLSAADWIVQLARAHRGIVVHGTHLGRDPVAIARLARHRDRLCVAVCPRTTRAISGVLPPVPLFREAGIRVAIGTDSRASSPDLSVLAECRTLTDGGLCSPAESLHMATIAGAWALGFDRQAGLLAPGRPADLVILQPTVVHRDPHEAVLDPSTRIQATLRAGRIIGGTLDD